MSKIVIRSKLGLLIQFVGVCCSYISILLIARFEGPAAQGTFVAIKNFVDTVYALFMAGLPQALILVINRSQFNVRSASIYIEIYSVAIFLLSILITWKFMWLDLSTEALLFLSAGIVGMSLFGLTRALLLTRTDGFFFSIFTVAPPSLILFFVAIHLFAIRSDYLHVYLYFGVSLFTISQAVLVYLYILRRNEPLVKMPFRSLFSENIHSFAQAIFYNGQLFLVLKILGEFGTSLDDIGKISTSVLPLLALHALIGVVAPILYNQWSKQGQPTQMSMMLRYLGKVAFAMQCCSIVILPIVGPITMMIFGPAYAESVPAIWVVLFATFPVALTRLLSPYLQTSGRAALNSVSCLIRIAASVIFLLIALRLDTSINVIVLLAIVWSAAEWLALVFIFIARSLPPFAPRAIGGAQ